MAFQQELAVKLGPDKKRIPVQPSDVCENTGIDRRHFREYMDCLESQGLAKIEGWTKGRFKLYAYAVPQSLPSTDDVTRAVTLFAGCSPELDTLLRHYRVRIPSDFVPDPVTIAELERRARVTKEAEMSLRQYAKCHCNGSAYKDERNREKQEEETSSSNPLKVQVEPTTTVPPPEPTEPRIEPIPAEPEAIQNIPVEEPKATPGTPRDPEIATIAGNLGMDNGAAQRILREVRARRPDATALEIVRAGFYKMQQVGGKAKTNMNGLLIVSIPEMAETDEIWLPIRSELTRQGLQREELKE
jgi:hypothetical protein